jgi:uncharacterized protein (TIGR03437 family)
VAEGENIAVIPGASNLVFANLAPQSFATIFGQGFVAGAPVTDSTMPETLAGITVGVRSLTNNGEFPARIHTVAPGQINILFPAGLPLGSAATLTVRRDGREVGSARVTIQNVAPGLFTADATGRGWATGLALYYRNGEFQAGEALTNGPASPNPVRAAAGDVFLSLFGTGIRGVSRTANVRVTIATVPCEVTFAASPEFPGLDQVNVRVPAALAGFGDADLVLTADGYAANTVRVRFQ